MAATKEPRAPAPESTPKTVKFPAAFTVLAGAYRRQPFIAPPNGRCGIEVLAIAGQERGGGHR